MARILVVEDVAAVREFVRRALAHDGHEVAVAEDGLRGLALMTDGDFDLLLTDIVMPGLDGIALALKVAKEFPDVRILLMTGYAAERQRAHNLDALIHRVIPKPFSLQEICRVVKEVLAEWPATSPPGNGGGKTAPH
jgi:two-component system cell cycle response regulator CpdR